MRISETVVYDSLGVLAGLLITAVFAYYGYTKGKSALNIAIGIVINLIWVCGIPLVIRVSQHILNLPGNIKGRAW